MEPRPSKISLIAVGLLVLSTIILATAIILEQTNLDNSSNASYLFSKDNLEIIMKDDEKEPSLFPCSNNNYCKSGELCVSGYCK